MKAPNINGEIDWLAIDSGGCIALLCSAGFGPVPELAFQKWDEQRRIEEHLIKLCGYSGRNEWLRAEWRGTAWSLSKAGVFLYDWKHWNGPYRQVGFPLFPRRIDRFSFPPDLRDAFVSLPKRFWLHRKLRPELLLPCTSAAKV